jgi:phospholipase/carboxylesterase
LSESLRPHVWRSQSGATRTLLLLHGTGADEYDLLNLGKDLDSKANLLSPRGLVDENGMNRFFVRYPDGSFDEESIKSNVLELHEFLNWASQNYGFDPGNLIAVGFSNGANTALALLQLFPESLSGVVAFGCTKPFDSTPGSPDLAGKVVFLANGTRDPYSPEAKTTALVKELTLQGAKVRLLSHEGGHQISGEHVSTIAAEL